ncbi:chromosomal replication initiator protein DnaA, partial [Sphingosinicella sp.]|uniref:chromosomal replication initiator protein DnaA n=1 Tax=Sphingosinicella sp. TaxID=1917971 RepID=UPI0026169D43
MTGRGSAQGVSMFLSGTDSAEAIWQTIRAHLRAEYGARTYDSWLKPLALVSVDADTVTLGSPTHFTADWIRNHFAERLRLLWAAQSAAIQHVRIVVENGLRTASAPEPEQPLPVSVREVPTFGVALESRYTFDSFVVGKANELAYNAARTVAEGGPIDFNPLFLHGTTGLGKTHLMHAIGWQIRNAVPGAKVVYMSAEKFMVEFVSAMRDKDTLSFKQKLRTADLLMIDDVQFIAGKDSTQEEFFHTMNEIISAGKRLVITADRSPQNLEGIENRILSRLAWGLVADINPADYELRLSILLEKMKRLPGANVGEDVIDFLARKITSNVRELEGALIRIIAHATLVGRPIGLESTQEVLHDLLRANDRRVTIEEIQKRVAEHFNIRVTDMHSARRARAVARPRQVAM